MKRLLLISTSGLLFLSSCMRIPNDLMQPNIETLKIREAQSRTFNTKSDKQLLQASISVLQDMGYTIKESSSEYGVLTAEKEANAMSTGQVLGSFAFAILFGNALPFDVTKYITVSMVVLDNRENDNTIARTTFQRVIVRTDDTRYVETVTDENIYQEFYEKLDKSLFLKVNDL